MIVTSIDRLAAFWQKHADAKKALTAWLHSTRAARWRSLMDVRHSYAAATDGVVLASGRIVTVFNIRSNTYRLLTAIDYELQSVQVLEILIHAEYDKEKWKKTL